MSWLNSSLNTIKGQLTNLAHEVLEQTAGPGDLEYSEDTQEHAADRPVDNRTALQLLAETQKEKELLDSKCSEKETEVCHQMTTRGGPAKPFA